MRLVASEGKMSISLLSTVMHTTNEIKETMSVTGDAANSSKVECDGVDGSIRLPLTKALSTGEIISVASFSSISHILEQRNDPVAEITLDCDFTILGASTDTASDLQRPS